ncbi:hypothetical protein QQO71_09615 [Clostridioides difficile]|uniref:hypothetical protein n=1 Tax=Clostridioides difficile TaxID=1496 RepID=UPI00254A631D|nr:hypothetical protein [Clostridioides difficile]MDL0339579.1 hypothetical protein [Clostridioides difficile]
MKEEIFLKIGSKTACLFPIWSEERKNFQKGHYIYLFCPYMVRKKKKVKNFSVLVSKMPFAGECCM